ncbi:hypothetical protein [Gaopeijia maritima]|uniref:Uncharacterized protein n=1 Tax=Gaopeijia maritima TaxID=3119007 RepID=A0ABU9EFG1_9BACT
MRIKTDSELDLASRTIASLALQHLRQDGTLRVRQRDQLHRALATAAEALDWTLIPGDGAQRLQAAAQDMQRLTRAGADALERDFAERLDAKKAETKTLRKVMGSVRALADDDDTSFPAEISYAHTARNGSHGLYTKVETLTVRDASEVEGAAAALEKNLDKFDKLRTEMLAEMKLEKRQIEEMRKTVASFVGASNSIVDDVLAALV